MAIGGLLGVAHPILNPITGLLGASGEILGEARRNGEDVRVRALANVAALGLGFGASWTPGPGNVSSVIEFQAALRRGGLVGDGSLLRVDWMPASRAIDFGVQLPIFQPFAGRTRPTRTTAPLPVQLSQVRAIRDESTPSQAVDAALASLASDADLIRAYASIYSANDAAAIESASRAAPRERYEDLVRAYDDALAAAFSIAVNDSALGVSVAARARTQVLEDFILPFDALFGQAKTSGTVATLLGNAKDHFVLWLRDSSRIDTERQRRTLAVFDGWLRVLSGVHARVADRWKDSRLLWLPPQLALSPDQYDEQDEVDGLVGQTVGRSFTSGNSLSYLRTADLPVEIARSIVAARHYHVLWTHDFTGRRPSGRLDKIAYTIAADAYLPALTAAVRRYDSTGVIPEYIILLDAFYYHARYGSLWMSILEHPLDAAVRLRGGEGAEAAHVRQRLAELRSAVESSARLNRDAASHGGRAWLARLVKVHVNVVLPSDFSFRSGRMVPPFPFISDNISRDHRKLVLYDLTEARPNDGELLVTGIGIGEHYASATWEDRGFRVRGPAALEARDAVRRALISNGFRENQIPEALRPSTPPRLDSTHDGDRRNVSRVLQVHNEAGFGAKQSSAARAMLYSLAPAGSVIIVPDPLWLSEVWAGMLAGAAARGCRVMIIAPASANAPSPEPPVIALERDMLQRILAVRNRLGEPIRRAGGELRVGIYAAQAPVTDARGRLQEIREGLARAPWIHELIPFDSAAINALDRATAQEANAERASILARDETPREPQLHQKTVLIARPGAIATLVREPGWAGVLAQTLRDQARETVRLADAISAKTPAPDTAAARAAGELLQSYERSLSDADRKRLSFYFLAGSQNHDDRGLALDAETSLIVSGFDASVGLVDLFYLMARSTWIDSDAQIDRFVPAPPSLMAWLGKLLRLAM
jgi:phosphatidylserine/phosphatidylglycerophosphate/cardiolipin synthase-like enzyme